MRHTERGKQMDLLHSPQADGLVPVRPGRPAPMYLTNPALGTVVPEDVPAQYWRHLWRMKWVVAGCAAAGVAVGLAVAALQTPIYRTKAVLELQTLNQNYLDMKSIDPVGGNDSLETFLQTQIQLLSSRSLLSRTVQKLQESNPPEIPLPSPAAWRMAGRPQTETEPTGLAAEKIAKDLVVKGSGLTRLVEIVAESPHPELAADFANTLA